MCISQSTLSMHISALEKNLNLTLFIRTKRKVELSPEGQILFPKLQYMDNLLEETIAEARNLHKSHANILRIGYINGMSPDKILVPILGSFRETYPEVKVELKRSDHNILVEETAQNMLDAVFAHEQSLQMNSAFTGRIVFESLYVLCPPGAGLKPIWTGFWKMSSRKKHLLLCLRIQILWILYV